MHLKKITLTNPAAGKKKWGRFPNKVCKDSLVLFELKKKQTEIVDTDIKVSMK